MIEQLCPPRPSGLGITISGDEWWSGQQETIEEIASAFWTNKFVLANIPTGGGKTIVGTAVQRLLGKTALYLCHTIQLQRQCQETMPWAVLAMGRGNYPCGRDKDDSFMKLFGTMTAQDCEDYGGCREALKIGPCEYAQMLEKAAYNPQVIMNYAYALRILQAGYIGGQENPFRRSLLIADEGHLTENALVEATTISLWKGPCKDAGLPEWPKSNDPYQWIAWAMDSLEAAEQNYNKAKEFTDKGTDYSVGLGPTNSPDGIEALVEERKAKGLYDTIMELRRLDPTDWVVSYNDKEVKLRPLWAWSVADDRLWRHFDRVLIMSASLGPPQTLMTKLAIPPDQALYIDVPSTFPLENRPIFYCPAIKVNRNTEALEWQSVASVLKHIADMPRLANQKAIIHTTSYKVVHALIPYLMEDERFLFHTDARQKEALINILKDTEPQGRFVLSPSLGTGVDIPNVRWQAIVKVPFGDLGDRVTRMRKDYQRGEDRLFGQRNYKEEAMNNVVQAAGRAVRGPTDWGVTYILDANFWMLFKTTHSPQFFKEAVQWLKT
mgnify:CR=1 FL=1